ncbi:hypothetical protein [Nibrella saemangeumensis]
MKRNQIVFIGLLLLSVNSLAQKIKKQVAAVPTEFAVPMTAEAWTFKPDKVEFITHKGVPTMKIAPNSEQVSLKNVTFENGTIEFDVEPQDPRFMGIYFRQKDANESEYVYLRVVQATTNPLAADAIQSAPYIKGVLLWDMMPQFQGPALVKVNEWNHIKLVVSGKQMRVYVNDMARPALHIPYLEADATSGSISLDGAAMVSRFVIKPGVVQDVPNGPGYDPTHTDPRYLRHWQMSAAIDLPPGQEAVSQSLPKDDIVWTAIDAERQGMVNITRQLGGSTKRRFVWLKTKITASTAHKALLRLGFSDEVWGFVNGQPVFVDKNLYRSSAGRKNPDGRCSIDNSSFVVPLKAGDNELLIGIANDFYGWGLVARLESLEDIKALE